MDEFLMGMSSISSVGVFVGLLSLLGLMHAALMLQYCGRIDDLRTENWRLTAEITSREVSIYTLRAKVTSLEVRLLEADTQVGLLQQDLAHCRDFDDWNDDDPQDDDFDEEEFFGDDDDLEDEEDDDQ